MIHLDEHKKQLKELLDELTVEVALVNTMLEFLDDLVINEKFSVQERTALSGISQVFKEMVDRERGK